MYPELAHGVTARKLQIGEGLLSMQSCLYNFRSGLRLSVRLLVYTLTAPVDTFTIARTVYAGFYNSSGNGADLANFDNFSVATIPEPATFAVVLGFALLLCIRDRAAGAGVRMWLRETLTKTD